MASTTLANQDSTISNKQKLSISLDFEDDNTTSSNVQLDVNAMNKLILQVLTSFPNTNLGTTEVSGGLISDTINANDIIVDELIFSSDGQVIDMSDIRLDISNLKTSVSYLSSIIT